MEGTGKKSAPMNPILLKAGIPFAVALGAFIYSVTKTRRKLECEGSSPKAQVRCDETDCQEDFRDQECCDGLHSASKAGKGDIEEEEKFIEHAQILNSFQSFRMQDSRLEEEIFDLMNQVSALRDREQELEKRFVQYSNLKEHESVVKELQHMLELETSHVEFLGMMVEAMEAEKQRLEAVIVRYLRAVEQLDSARQENGLLQKKVKKLSRSTRERSRLLSRQALVLQDREAELLKSNEELERREGIIKESQDEIMELKRKVDQLQKEKKELAEKLEFAEAPAPSTPKIEAEKNTTEGQKQLLAELEQLRKAQATNKEELIYLRWVNACLKHEFMRSQQEQQQMYDHEMEEQPELIFEGQDEKKEQKMEYDSDSLFGVSEQGELQTTIVTAEHKKPKLLNKLRRWVKGSEGCRRSCDVKEFKHEQHIRRLSTSDGPTVQPATPRASWASA